MNDYLASVIGIPFVSGGREEQGLDCWGLVQKVFRDIHQVELPSYPGIEAESTSSVARTMTREIAQKWEAIEKPEDWCVVTLSGGSIVHHVGIYTPAGRVLHSVPGSGSVHQSISGLRAMGLTVKSYLKLK